LLGGNIQLTHSDEGDVELETAQGDERAYVPKSFDLRSSYFELEPYLFDVRARGAVDSHELVGRPGARLRGPIARETALVDCLPENVKGAFGAGSRVEDRSAEQRQRPNPERFAGRQQRNRAPQEVVRRIVVSTVMRARSRTDEQDCRPVGRVALVYQSELAPVARRLLEVMCDDLLELA
jgi:hypothetical protein